LVLTPHGVRQSGLSSSSLIDAEAAFYILVSTELTVEAAANSRNARGVLPVAVTLLGGRSGSFASGRRTQGAEQRDEEEKRGQPKA
jgi:hypothetical protein